MVVKEFINRNANLHFKSYTKNKRKRKVVEWKKDILLNITKTCFKIDRTLQFNHTK